MGSTGAPWHYLMDPGPRRPCGSGGHAWPPPQDTRLPAQRHPSGLTCILTQPWQHKGLPLATRVSRRGWPPGVDQGSEGLRGSGGEFVWEPQVRHQSGRAFIKSGAAQGALPLHSLCREVLHARPYPTHTLTPLMKFFSLLLPLPF